MRFVRAPADQRNLGMSMRVERSSLDQVKKRFEVNKKKLEEKQKEYDFEERMKELREEVRAVCHCYKCVVVWSLIEVNCPWVCQEEKAKAYKKEKQKERKRRAEDDVDFEEDDEMAAVMGFSGFGSSKKSHWSSPHQGWKLDLAPLLKLQTRTRLLNTGRSPAAARLLFW